MVNAEKSAREPLFHISRRDDLVWWKRLIIRIVTVVLAFLIAGVLSYLLIGVDPFNFIGKLFTGTFGTDRRAWISLRDLAVLLCIALALVPAFKMKFWNIGAEGQVLMGGLGAAICMHYLGGRVPDAVVYLCMVFAGLLFGMVWGVLPAVCKAFWKTNETLFTLMMNYVAVQLIAFFTDTWVKAGSGVLKNETHLNGIRFPELGNAYVLPILVAVLLAVAIFVYLRYSKQGYELCVVGESENTARYVGINVRKVIIRTMAISGAICGLTGVLLTGAINGTVTTQTAGGQGFTAIIVAWIGKFNPAFMVLSAFLIIFLDRGTNELNLTNDAFSAIVTALVVFFIIGCEFFISYRIKFRHTEKRTERTPPPDGPGERPSVEEGAPRQSEQNYPEVQA